MIPVVTSPIRTTPPAAPDLLRRIAALAPMVQTTPVLSTIWATNTVPSVSAVAEWPARRAAMLAVGVNVPVEGLSKGSCGGFLKAFQFLGPTSVIGMQSVISAC